MNISLRGTPPWMSPEAIMKLNVTLGSDVYSFGIVLWELLTWQSPFIQYDSRALSIDGYAPKLDIASSSSSSPSSKKGVKYHYQASSGTMSIDGDAKESVFHFTKQTNKQKL